MVSVRKRRIVLPYVKPSRDELDRVSFAGIILIIFAVAIFFTQRFAEYFWLFLVAGIILLSNSLWLRKDFARPFGLKHVFTMLKTKRFIKTIQNAVTYAKWLEKLSLFGIVFGFGLAGVDYLFAKKFSFVKRIIVLLVAMLLLGLFFQFFLTPLFAMPILQQLALVSLIGFVFLGFGGMSLAMLLGYGVISFAGLFAAKELCPALMPVIPGVPIPGIGFAIPVVGWVSLVIVLVVHEFSHGILMAYYKEKINSVGVLLAGIFPIGAFVDQEDSTFEKLDDKKALAVLSAGPASNLFLVIVAWVLLNLFVFSVLPFSSQIQSEYGKAYSGVRVVSVSDTVSYCGLTVDSPAKGKLFSGDIVKSVNGTDINGISVLNYAFLDANGEMLFTVSRLNTDTNTFSDINVPLTPYKFEDLGIKRVGVEFGAISTGYEPRGEIVALQFVLSNISMILLLLFVISFAAGSFNYLPSDPFDGGKMAKIILEPYFGFMKFKSKKETRKFIGRLFIWLVLLAFLLNIIPYITLIF